MARVRVPVLAEVPASEAEAPVLAEEVPVLAEEVPALAAVIAAEEGDSYYKAFLVIKRRLQPY